MYCGCFAVCQSATFEPCNWYHLSLERCLAQSVRFSLRTLYIPASVTRFWKGTLMSWLLVYLPHPYCEGTSGYNTFCAASVLSVRLQRSAFIPRQCFIPVRQQKG
ncbi:hypothetical protein AX15_004528 [Amanita polypyramis BW_CC]|nr:hypothetical protein AX15_004528 [Amanita polypyramis BW_CC]